MRDFIEKTRTDDEFKKIEERLYAIVYPSRSAAAKNLEDNARLECQESAAKDIEPIASPCRCVVKGWDRISGTAGR
jgi:hypothetical protein